MASQNVKVLVLGCTGRTCLLMTYSTNVFPNDYIPSIYGKVLPNYCCDKLILVGLKIDLRDEAGTQELVSKEAALKIAAEFGASEYHECSARTKEGLLE
jgi:GTPase SAR1 family protein